MYYCKGAFMSNNARAILLQKWKSVNLVSEYYMNWFTERRVRTIPVIRFIYCSMS